MAAFRLLLILLLGAGLVCYAIFVFTGRAQWRSRAKRLVLGTITAVLLFGFLIWLQASLT